MSLEMGELYRLHGVEVARMRANNNASFASHTHAEYVVSANLRGSERIRIDGKEMNATARMVTVYNPEAVQSSTFAADSDDAEFVSLYIDPAEIIRIGQANDWLSRTSAPELAQGAFSNPDLYRQVLSTYHAARASNRADFDAALTELAATLLSRTECRMEVNPRLLACPRFKSVIEFMKANLGAPLSLDVLSTLGNFSKYQLIRAFKSALGIAPAKYHMQLRLIEARRLLRQGMDVRDVSFSLGFYDQSHFINAFKKFTGVSPARFALADRAVKIEVPE